MAAPAWIPAAKPVPGAVERGPGAADGHVTLRPKDDSRG
jgi:hypothetical protein